MKWEMNIQQRESIKQDVKKNFVEILSIKENKVACLGHLHTYILYVCM